MNILWLWLRAHRWPTLLAVCLGVAVLNVLVGGQGVPVPTLTSIRRLDLPLRQFLPLVMACAIGLHSRNPSQTFTVTPRPALVLRARAGGGPPRPGGRRVPGGTPR
nr:hypothetical protein GCM10020241_07090 [Streptoalloteichus tenebrarius]